MEGEKRKTKVVVKKLKKIGPEKEVIYQEKDLIGTGQFGEVYMGVMHKTLPVAVKKILVPYSVLTNGNQKFQREIDCMRELQHEHIIKLHFCFVDKEEDRLYIVSEKCQSRTLLDQITDKMSEGKVFEYCNQLISAMNYMHNEKKIMHRDLKPQNILISEQNSIKIGDLGLAKAVLGDQIERVEYHTSVGTPIYACPEIILNRYYNAKCDVWSAGAIFFQMLTQITLFGKAKTFYKLKTMFPMVKDFIKQAKIQANQKFWKNILNRMLQVDEADRASFTEIHQLFQQERTERQRAREKKIETIGGFESPQKEETPKEETPNKPLKTVRIINKAKFEPSLNKPKLDMETMKNSQNVISKMRQNEMEDKKAYIAINEMNFYRQRTILNFEAVQRLLNAPKHYPVQNHVMYVCMFLLFGEFYSQVLIFKDKYMGKTITLHNGNKVQALNHKFLLAQRQKNSEEMTHKLSKVQRWMATIQKKLHSYSSRSELSEFFAREKEIILCIKNTKIDQEQFDAGKRTFFAQKFKKFYLFYHDSNMRVPKNSWTQKERILVLQIFAFLSLVVVKNRLFQDCDGTKDNKDKIAKKKEQIDLGNETALRQMIAQWV